MYFCGNIKDPQTIRSAALTSVRLNWGWGRGGVSLTHPSFRGNIKALLKKPRELVNMPDYLNIPGEGLPWKHTDALRSDYLNIPGEGLPWTKWKSIKTHIARMRA